MHKPIYTQKAKEDLSAINKFISQDNEFYADKVLETIFGFINGLLSLFPDIGRINKSKKNRQVIEPTFKYKITYSIIEDTINILSISKKRD